MRRKRQCNVCTAADAIAADTADYPIAKNAGSSGTPKKLMQLASASVTYVARQLQNVTPKRWQTKIANGGISIQMNGSGATANG